MNNTGELFLFPFLEPGYNHHLLSASWKNIKITKKKSYKTIYDGLVRAKLL
jgi:hypothetical protein